MGKKNVIPFLVELEGGISFEDVLLNRRFHTPYNVTTQKTIELCFIEQSPNNNIITGLFVTTQRRGIPPTHTPGGDDYSAVQLNDGQGLAYPNTILYDPVTHVLYLERNMIGVSEKRVCEYFKEQAKINGISNFAIDLIPILKSEAYERVNNLDIIDCMECKIATPIQMIRDLMQTESLGNFGNLARSLNATKEISIIVKAEEASGGISKQESLGFLRLFELLNRRNACNKKDKLNIKGRKASLEHDGMVEEDIKFFLDRITGSFNLEEPNVASDLQYHDRKEGIKSVYDNCNNEIMQVIGPRR